MGGKKGKVGMQEGDKEVRFERCKGRMVTRKEEKKIEEKQKRRSSIMQQA